MRFDDSLRCCVQGIYYVLDTYRYRHSDICFSRVPNRSGVDGQRSNLSRSESVLHVIKCTDGGSFSDSDRNRWYVCLLSVSVSALATTLIIHVF